MSEHDGNSRTVIPEHLMLSRLAQSEQMREFFIQMWLQNPVLAKQGGSKVKNLLSTLTVANEEEMGYSSDSPRDGADKKQRGFSLVSAIFLLVVIAALGAFAVTLSTTQQQSSALDVMGARAYQAARTGIEWGAYQVLRNGGACAAATTLPAGTLAGTLSGFDVTVNCISTAHTGVTIYQLTSTATQGAVGTTNYVERQMAVTIAR